MVQILFLTVFAVLLARVVRAPKGTWRFIVGAAILILAGSQLLPEGNAFREDVRGSGESLLWLGLALIPVAAYALLIRRIRARTIPPEERGPARPPTGLVLVPNDAAFARDTERALAAEAGDGPERVSVGWRNPAGQMVGHARLRIASGVADLELLWVAAPERGHGIGARLVDQAATEARLRGASDLVATAPARAAAYLQRHGFSRYAAFTPDDGEERLHLRRNLV